ncbi:MAG: sugar transferase [Candidatus Margulisiibacteriota bacterium]
MAKRVFDMIFSSLLLVVLSPLLAIIALLIKVDSPGPVLFVQDRIGKDFEPFKVYKFRTMVNRSSKRGLLVTLRHDPRITGLGHFLRHYKLDELPQLVNVLKGDMSMVGPRPEIPKTVEKYTEKERTLLSVKPGLTSPASIKFIQEEKLLPSSSRQLYRTYYGSVIPQKLECDLKYLRERSFLYDIWIIIETIIAIAKIPFSK